MKLEIPVVRQGKDSFDCGLACLSMLFRYYGFNKSISDMKNDIKVYGPMGTYAPQLGKYLIENGFEVELITINPYLFTKKINKKSSKELIDYFEDLSKNNKKNKFRKPLKFFKEFLKVGGKLSIRVPTINDIKEEISERRPLGALITSNFLLFDKASFNFHFNLITGIDDKFIYVNDPMWDYRGGKHEYPIMILCMQSMQAPMAI
ncbi:C39 family peptidase [Candidatus Woesearchaeota archaeon]|nr:C39 family peptidase [Candidatus Woesearchaeota archaeon]